MAKNTSCGVQLRIRGKVQGIGFRPFVWQLAQQLNLHGDVCIILLKQLLKSTPVILSDRPKKL